MCADIQMRYFLYKIARGGNVYCLTTQSMVPSNMFCIPSKGTLIKNISAEESVKIILIYNYYDRYKTNVDHIIIR